LATGGNVQLNFQLISSMHKAPKDAPAKVLRQIESEAQAVRVAIKASGFKLAYFAASLGKSEGYISRIRSGQRPVPDWFVKPFCWVSGTRLLEQYQELHAAITECPHAYESRLSDQLRNAA
jgi:hypothetical protein